MPLTSVRGVVTEKYLKIPQRYCFFGSLHLPIVICSSIHRKIQSPNIQSRVKNQNMCNYILKVHNYLWGLAHPYIQHARSGKALLYCLPFQANLLISMWTSSPSKLNRQAKNSGGGFLLVLRRLRI